MLREGPRVVCDHDVGNRSITVWLEQWDQTGAETMAPLLEPLSWAGSSRKQLCGTLECQGVRPAQQPSRRFLEFQGA